MFRKFHRETPVLESLANNDEGLKTCNFIGRNAEKHFFHKTLSVAAAKTKDMVQLPFYCILE